MLTAGRGRDANCKSGAGTAEFGLPSISHDLIWGAESPIDPRRQSSNPFGYGPE